MNKWIATYRIATEDDFGTFSIAVDIPKGCDYWAVAEAMFPHAYLNKMDRVP